eukprot:gene7777-7975_t
MNNRRQPNFSPAAGQAAVGGLETLHEAAAGVHCIDSLDKVTDPFAEVDDFLEGLITFTEPAGVFAVNDIEENQLLCMIPRKAILSRRTTQLADLLEEERLGGGLALTIAVMYESSLGCDSQWAGYFQSLPQREYLPMFWSDPELQLLVGTALEGCAEEDRRDTEEDYQQHVLPLMQKHCHAFPHPDLCSLDCFRVAASWVASRSFHVDAWHGDAMVPLADIFNHKASLVLLGDSWKEADGDSTQEDEEVEDEEAEDEEAEDEEAEDDEGPQHGFAVGGMPVIAAGAVARGSIVNTAAGEDRGRKRRRTENRQQQQEAEGQLVDQQQACNDQQQQSVSFPEQRLDIIAASAVAHGCEVHNTYGELSNPELLHKYGFCLPQNPFDEVELGPDWRWMLEEVGGAELMKTLAPQIKWLQRHSNVLQHEPSSGSDGADTEEEEMVGPPAALPFGRLGRASAAIVKVLGAQAAQLQSWQCLEDVLAGADEKAEADDMAMAQHFEDIMLTRHPLTWWGKPGLELLLQAVQHRVQRYPSGQLSVEADLQALQQQKQSYTQRQAGGGEHAAAVTAALQLRVCEQTILMQLQEAAQQVLHGDQQHQKHDK